MQEKEIKFTLNGVKTTAYVETTLSLIDLLRGKLQITSAKKSCEKGECGACTVIVNGKAVNSCLVLAVSVDDKNIDTLEGIGRPDNLHPLQKEFYEIGAAQCGYCTPGLIMAAKALLDENPNPTEHEVKIGISGNLCRCTGYVKPIKAVLNAAKAIKVKEENVEKSDSEPTRDCPLWGCTKINWKD